MAKAEPPPDGHVNMTDGTIRRIHGCDDVKVLGNDQVTASITNEWQRDRVVTVLQSIDQLA
jgi:hypothetical protein